MLIKCIRNHKLFLHQSKAEVLGFIDNLSSFIHEKLQPKRHFFSKHSWLLYGATDICDRAVYPRCKSNNSSKGIQEKNLHMLEKVIQRCVKNFKATGNISPPKQSGRPTTARTPQNIQLVKDIVEANPKASVRRIAQQVEICQRSAHTILKKDISQKPYQIHVVQKLEPQDYEKRKQFASWFINQCELNPNLQRRSSCQVKQNC